MSILSDELIQKVKNFDTSTITPEQTTSFSAIWSFLKASEEEFIEMMHSQSETGNGNVEYGPALYILNNDIGSITTEFLRKYLNMPTSRILPGQWSTWWDQMKNGPGVVATDGTLFVTSARAGISEVDLSKEQLAGSLFTLSTSTSGVPISTISVPKPFK